MTIGQLMEALESKVCGLAGRRHGDASPFNGRTVEDIADELEALGMRRYGDEIMYNPRTGGERISTPIFFSPLRVGSHKEAPLGARFASLRLGDGQIEYCAPEELYGYPTYNGPLYHVTSPTTDIVVTPEHRLCVQPGRAAALLMLVFSGTLEIEMSSQEKVDSLMHLALHAGEIVVVDPCGISGFVARLPLSVGAPDKCDFIAEGSIVGSNGVYCVRMPRNETFFVRRNGRAVWTGNSRAANGPVVLLTRQPAEGRARDGGLRLGEMEMECLWAHGTMGFLKERFMECSDNYRVFVCKCCGMMAHANPESNLFYCKSCKNLTEFNELRIPYASKLLVQEVETMAIALDSSRRLLFHRS
eukprot:gene5406-5631_t